MKKINWQIIVGAILAISGILSVGDGIGTCITGLVCGGALAYWGYAKIQKEDRDLQRRKAEESRAQAEREAQQKAFEELLEKKKSAYEKLVESIPTAVIKINDSRSDLLDTGCLADIPNSNITKRSDWNKLGNFVVIDTETTGLRATCDVLEIAAVRFRDWEPVEKFHSLCSSDSHIPEDATKINHITDDMVAGKPHFRQLTPSLLDFLGTDALIGHNIGFDLKFIVRNGADVTTAKRKYYDTLEIAQRTLTKYEDVDNYKLPTLCQYYGIYMLDAHRADCDAIATGLLFKHLAHDRIEGMPSIPDIEITE